MYLRFETQPETAGIPLLVDVENCVGEERVAGVKIDDGAIDLDDQVIARFQGVLTRIHTEPLPPKHFRDCIHFAMAMSGAWPPTHPPYDRDFDMVTECFTQTDREDHIGPTALGIPNDSHCMGFGPVPFVYSHAVFGVDSSRGTLCFSKLGVSAEYSLSTFGAALSEARSEVSHPITKLAVKSAGVQVFSWRAEES